MIVDHILAHAPIVEHALDTTLANLTAPITTTTLTARLFEALVAANVYDVDQNELGAYLAKLAARHPNATHDGDTFVRFGRTNRRWRWHPTPQRLPAAPEPTLAERLAQLEARVTRLEAQSESLSDIL